MSCSLARSVGEVYWGQILIWDLKVGLELFRWLLYTRMDLLACATWINWFAKINRPWNVAIAGVAPPFWISSIQNGSSPCGGNLQSGLVSQHHYVLGRSWAALPFCTGTSRSTYFSLCTARTLWFKLFSTIYDGSCAATSVELRRHIKLARHWSV